jgi:glycosyltransferase involved in cell wall biosynthesis
MITDEHLLKAVPALKAKPSPLTVLHVAPINKPIRSDLGYGPIETVIYNVDKGLRLSGHRSIVACSADSSIAGEHFTTVERSLGDYCREETSEQRAIVNSHLVKALERARMGDIDIIHMHGWLECIYGGMFNPDLPIVMTLHVPAKNSGMDDAQNLLFNTMLSPSMHFVSISDYQKRQYHGLDNLETVHHGINVDDYPFGNPPDKQDYLFMIGRVTRDKGQDKAIETAKETGSKLIIAGCVQDKSTDREFYETLRNSIDLFADIGEATVDDAYYDNVMKPLLDSDKQIIYIGEASSAQKKQWYRHASATLFPIQWGEPFGLVLLESMACGTPVLAFSKGAVPEIVLDGITGFTVDTLDEMIAAVGHIPLLDPASCRRHVRNNFSAFTMAGRYSELYQRIVNRRRSQSAEDRTGMEFPEALQPVLAGGEAL